MPKKLREELKEDPFYKKCVRGDRNCKGRITWEHAMYYAGSQIQERWAIIPLCWHHHLGDGLVKDFNEWVALNRLFNDKSEIKRATKTFPKAIMRWKQRVLFLNKKYGRYK